MLCWTSMCQQAGRCVRWQTQAAVTAGGCWLESLRHLSHLSTGTKSGAQLQTTPRTERKAVVPLALHASFSVAEVVQVIVRLVLQIKQRLSCCTPDALLQRRAAMLQLATWTDPLVGSSAKSSLILHLQKSPEGSIQLCCLLCILWACSANPDGTIILTGEAPKCHWWNRNQSIAFEIIWAARERSQTLNRLDDLILYWTREWIPDRKGRHFSNWTELFFNIPS